VGRAGIDAACWTPGRAALACAVMRDGPIVAAPARIVRAVPACATHAIAEIASASAAPRPNLHASMCVMMARTRSQVSRMREFSSPDDSLTRTRLH
jgi:hypothetical protein